MEIPEHMLVAGKLYSCEEYYLMLYPDWEAARTARSITWRRWAYNAAAYWSNRLGKPVFYTEKNIPLLVLNDKEEYIEVLAGDRKGWIIFEDWLNIKEIK